MPGKSATKKYASPVSQHQHTQKYPNKAFRRMARTNRPQAAKAKRREGRRHPTVKGVLGHSFQILDVRYRPRAERDPVHATGALKRSERHPRRGKGEKRRDLVWRYVSR